MPPESRKRFKAALALLEAGESEALIFTKVDRASRCTEDFARAGRLLRHRSPPRARDRQPLWAGSLTFGTRPPAADAGRRVIARGRPSIAITRSGQGETSADPQGSQGTRWGRPSK